MSTDPVIALWAVNLAYPVPAMESWAALVDSQAASAKKAGADIFLMPEYASEQWLHFAPRLKPTEQIAWMAKQVPAALGYLQDIAAKRELLLVPGTFPAARPEKDPPVCNRAHVFFPDGRRLIQDKLCLTPKEKNPDGWMLSPGAEVEIFGWKGFRLAVVTCLDIELPALSAKLAREDLDLILVPSMTKKPAGYHRVFGCAKARAVELQAAIAAVGVIGGGPLREPNYGGASLFLPCEEAFGHTGILKEIPPASAVEGPGPLLTARLPLSAIRAMRAGGQAEVWPGAWTADHLRLNRTG